MNAQKIERLYQVLIQPHITEKATRIADAHNQIIFRITQNAKKIDIKEAVEMIFNVKVTNVQTLKQQSKTKRRGSVIGKRPGWKKAIVTIAKGQEIDFASPPAATETAVS